MATKAICVWYDETTGDEAGWIVSRDELDSAGRAETTSTIGVYDDEDDALAAGRAAARKAGLPLYRNPADGRTVLVEAARPRKYSQDW